jgi:hypothetical protein
MDTCIRACLECHRICLHCVIHCLTKGGSHAEVGHIRIMMDCAQICATTADFMIRESQHGKHLARECAEICRQCADSCGNHPEADDHMKKCAQACLDCAAECEKMVA